MDKASLIRYVYGFSISLHNFFADIPLGIAIVHLGYLLWANKLFAQKISPLTRSIFDMLVISIVLAVMSGFALELEFPRYWPDFYSSLKILNQHIGHQSAIFSFFISSLLIVATYYYRLWNYPLFYLFISIVWVFLAWLFGAWGIFINTIMQNPANAYIQNGILRLNDSTTTRFFSDYHLIRQAHIAAASILKASVIILAMWCYFDRSLLISQMRRIAVFILLSLMVLAITGHFQALNASKTQPSKFAAMEGLLSEADKSSWHFWGYMYGNEKVVYFSTRNLLPKLTDAKLTSLNEIPVSDRPPIAIVFNSFRIMIYSLFFIFLLTLYVWQNPRQILEVLILILLFVELATNSGWIVSEVGRQPWVYFGLQKRGISNNIPGMVPSLFALGVNSVLLIATTCFSIVFLKRNWLKNFVY